MPVIDRGMFHNIYYVHVCKQLFLCDALIKSCDILSRRERKKQRIKGKTMAQWMNVLWKNNFIY